MVRLMIKDEQGRIKYLELEDVNIHNGHSVCDICGKDMPICWDVVCAECHGTFCYDCSIAVDGFWYCKNHAPVQTIFDKIKLLYITLTKTK
jgi:hypothetical protein